MHNEVTLVGHVGGSIAVREIGDTRLARFTLATDRVWRDRDGQRHDATDWHLCTLSGPTLDTFVERVAKGTLLLLKGSLRTRRYERDGATHYVTEVRIGRWLLLQPGSSRPAAGDALDETTEVAEMHPDDDLTPQDLPAAG